VTESTKKKRFRQTVCLIDLGMTFSGFSLSPAAIPINSVPWNEKFTVITVISKADIPFGKRPSLKKSEKNGDSYPPFI